MDATSFAPSSGLSWSNWRDATMHQGTRTLRNRRRGPIVILQSSDFGETLPPLSKNKGRRKPLSQPTNADATYPRSITHTSTPCCIYSQLTGCRVVCSTCQSKSTKDWTDEEPCAWMSAHVACIDVKNGVECEEGRHHYRHHY